MIESSEQALAYLKAVMAGEIAPENPECREAALVVTRELRQARQTLADHAQASGVREGDGAGVSDEALRRMAEEWLARWASVGADMSEEDERADMTVLLRRVATEAARLERERAEAAEAGEAALRAEALRAEALRHAGECARHAADDRAVIADLRAEVERLRVWLRHVIERQHAGAMCETCQSASFAAYEASPDLASGESREEEASDAALLSAAEDLLMMAAGFGPNPEQTASELRRIAALIKSRREPASAGPAEEVKP